MLLNVALLVQDHWKRLTLPCVSCGGQRIVVAVPELDAEIVVCERCDTP